MSYEIQKLTHVHLAMVELALAGLNQTDIAREMGMTPAGVGLVIKSPLFQDRLAERRDQQTKKIDQESCDNLNMAKEMLNRAAVAAANVHIDLLSSPDPKIKQLSATEILNRTLGKGGSSEGLAGTVVQLSPGAVLNLNLALQESTEGRRKPNLVEQTPEEPRMVASEQAA